MGYSPYYQAIPEGSRLFSRLRANRRLATLMDQFFPSASRPLDLYEAGEDEVVEVLEAVVEMEGGLFASPADAGQALAELREEIARAEVQHPGLIARTAFLNKSQDDIEVRLVKRLTKRGRADAAAFVDALLFGAEDFAEGFQARLVPSELVAEAAAALRDVEPELLFGAAEEDYHREDYRAWRRLYLEAGARGEAVLVY
jgi:hypothetical protein